MKGSIGLGLLLAAAAVFAADGADKTKKETPAPGAEAAGAPASATAVSDLYPNDMGPAELEDAARIDGASRLQTLVKIVLPLCGPGFISAGIFAFTLAQNEFLYALIFLTKTEVRTVPVGAIAELVRGDVFYWGQLMAAALLGSIPVAIIYSFFVEHYVAGLTAGGVKG